MKHLLLLLLLLAPPAFAQETLPSIVIAADDSIGLPLSRVMRDYARIRHIAVNLTPTDAETFRAQVAEGSSGDVLITARTAWLAELKQQGLVDIYSETTVTDDRLALVGPDSFIQAVNFDQGFPTAAIIAASGEEPVFVLGHPETRPEAQQSREVLKKLGADADLEPHIVYLKERGQIHGMILNQRAFGIVPALEAVEAGMHIIALLPGRLYEPISYKAVVLAGDNMDEARRFIEFLKSDEARAAFN